MLANLGVDPCAANFLGRDKGLADGGLHAHMDEAWGAIACWADGAGPVSHIYTHAWEGGHQDHDVCHVLALALAKRVSAGTIRQVACYRRPDTGLAPYSLLDPLAANGVSDPFVMSGAERAAMAKSVVAYPSQWRSWAGLGPPLLTRLALSAAFPVQPVSEARLAQRPHEKPLLYEVRTKIPFETVGGAVSAFLKRGP